MSRRFHENRPIAVADLKDRHLERVHPNAMHGLLIVPAAGTAHLKLSRWNQGANWFNHKRKSRPASPLGFPRYLKRIHQCRGSRASRGRTARKSALYTKADWF